jgi:hypothetical protein
MKTVTLSGNKRRLDETIAMCNFDRPLTFSEIAELSDVCKPLYLQKRPVSSFAAPLTFVVPVHQVVASISRFVE